MAQGADRQGPWPGMAVPELNTGAPTTAQAGTEGPGLCLNGGLGPWEECVGGDPRWGRSRPLKIISALQALTIGSNLSYRCLL